MQSWEGAAGCVWASRGSFLLFYFHSMQDGLPSCLLALAASLVASRGDSVVWPATSACGEEEEGGCQPGLMNISRTDALYLSYVATRGEEAKAAASVAQRGN